MANLGGFHRAKVVQTDARGRVRAKIPAVIGNAVSGWATPMFDGPAPASGDVVWVTFESGDKHRPIYLYISPGGE